MKILYIAGFVIVVTLFLLGVDAYNELQDMDTYIGSVSTTGEITIDPTQCKFVETDNGSNIIYCK